MDKKTLKRITKNDPRFAAGTSMEDKPEHYAHLIRGEKHAEAGMKKHSNTSGEGREYYNHGYENTKEHDQAHWGSGKGNKHGDTK